MAMAYGEKRCLVNGVMFFDVIRLDDAPLFAVRPIAIDSKWIKLRMESTATAFSGQRWWYVCPGCEKRVTSLYWKNCAFGCRKCHSLRYASQYETFNSEFDRLCMRLQKERVAIWGEDEPDVRFLMRRSASFKRPKGMRKKTFARKLKRLSDIEYRWFDIAWRYFNAWKTEG